MEFILFTIFYLLLIFVWPWQALHIFFSSGNSHSRRSIVLIFNFDMNQTSEEQRIIRITCISLFCIVNVVANLSLLITIAAYKRLRSVSNYIILNLIIADLLVGFLILPSWNYSFWFQSIHVKFCKFIAAVTHIHFLETLLTMALIAVDRCICISCTFEYSKLESDSSLKIFSYHFMITSWVNKMKAFSYS